MAEGTTIQKRSDASRLKEKQGLLLLHLIAAPDGATRQKDLTDRRIACGPEVRGPLERQGLVEVGPTSLALTDIGWYFVRAVAMVFDQPLQSDRARERYSRVI